MTINKTLSHEVSVTKHIVMEDDGSVDYRIKFQPAIMVNGDEHHMITLNLKICKNEVQYEIFDWLRFKQLDICKSSLKCIFESNEKIINSLMEVIKEYHKQTNCNINKTVIGF